MTLKHSRLNIAELSDVHLGHNKTSASHIVKNLYRAFPDNEITGELDIIWIAGDLFDSLLNLPSESVSEITKWATHFLKLCKKRDIVLRVLEGTPSHDWQQAKLLVDINEHADIGADLKYIQELSIEYIERFGIHILYVPDEWRPKNSHTWHEVQELLLSHQLSKVDFCIMHGCFTYQIPPSLLDMFETHDTENYIGITEYLIFIGHIHQHSQYKNILSAGSFDRLSHGEEEPKGHIRATVNKDGTYTAKFIVNEGAKTYLTLDYSGLSLDEVYRRLDELIPTIKDDSHVRIQASTEDAVFKAGSEIKARYKNIHLRFKSNERKVKHEPIVQKDIVKPINLTNGTILQLLSASLQENHPKIADNAKQYLSELLEEYDKSSTS